MLVIVSTAHVKVSVQQVFDARSNAEDVRYSTLRQDWGSTFQQRMFGLAIVQAPATALLAYERHNGLARLINHRLLTARIGWRYDGSAQSRNRLARETRIMTFREGD